MDWASRHNRAEQAVDAAAAAIFAAAVAFAAVALGGGAFLAMAVAALALWAVHRVLRRVASGETDHTIAAFAVAPVEWMAAAPDEAADELLLDDPLEAVATDARVVQLFGTGGGSPPVVPPDASEALSEALAQLRRSLH